MSCGSKSLNSFFVKEQQTQVSMSIEQPLPLAALQLAHVFNDHFGCACLTGSAVLGQYLNKLSNNLNWRSLPARLRNICHGFSSNDIDLFVPHR